MAGRSIQGSEALAAKIKSRRNELGLTIEEAALKAGVGTKTWSRYEAGESIRMDKCKGICKALNWHAFPDEEVDERIETDEYRKHRAWSSFLEKNFGSKAAMCFAAGSDILWDNINQDMEELAAMPKGSHIGQLGVSWLKEDLPEQFLVHYNYEFLYRMKCVLYEMIEWAHEGSDMKAHTVLQELILYLCNEEAETLIEMCGGLDEAEKEEDLDSEDWVFDLLDDEDIITCLYSNRYLTEDNIYHFSHWDERQFWVDSEA